MDGARVSQEGPTLYWGGGPPPRSFPWPSSKRAGEHKGECSQAPMWQECYEEKLVILSLGTPKHDKII
jgi:hypothetical protein